jgi:hypothetical protein
MCHCSDSNEITSNIFTYSVSELQDAHFDLGHCILAMLGFVAVSFTNVAFSRVAFMCSSYKDVGRRQQTFL